MKINYIREHLYGQTFRRIHVHRNIRTFQVCYAQNHLYEGSPSIFPQDVALIITARLKKNKDYTIICVRSELESPLLVGQILSVSLSSKTLIFVLGNYIPGPYSRFLMKRDWRGCSIQNIASHRLLFFG